MDEERIALKSYYINLVTLTVFLCVAVGAPLPVLWGLEGKLWY